MSTNLNIRPGDAVVVPDPYRRYQFQVGTVSSRTDPHERGPYVRIAESRGATLVHYSDLRGVVHIKEEIDRLTAEAPKFMVWMSDPVHELVESCWRPGPGMMPSPEAIDEARRRIRARMFEGLEECGDHIGGAGCDWCDDR